MPILPSTNSAADIRFGDVSMYAGSIGRAELLSPLDEETSRRTRHRSTRRLPSGRQCGLKSSALSRAIQRAAGAGEHQVLAAYGPPSTDKRNN